MPESGIVVKAYGGFFYLTNLHDASGTQELVEATIRGKLKMSTNRADLPPVVVGDRVDYISQDSTAVIVKVHPRQTELVRPPVANIDQVVLVVSAAEPAPDLLLMDKIMVRAEAEVLDLLIVVNKVDSASPEILGSLSNHLQGVPYQVVQTSAISREGIGTLSSLLARRISVLAGPSGVGKSSLLKKLVPGYNPRTQEVSFKSSRGRHTTKHVELLALAPGGYIADTPGFSNINLDGIELGELPLLFPEFSGLMDECRFSGCIHIPEPDCCVKQALKDGKISGSRYAHYCQMAAEIQARRKW